MSKTTNRAGRRARRWSHSEAAEALRECAKSGLTTEAFAKSEGYSGQRLRNWRTRLGGVPAAAEIEFVPVAITPTSRRPSASTTQCIAIDLGMVTVRVREDLDVEHVARIGSYASKRLNSTGVAMK